MKISKYLAKSLKNQINSGDIKMPRIQLIEKKYQERKLINQYKNTKTKNAIIK
jgi:hypothetical protein